MAATRFGVVISVSPLNALTEISTGAVTSASLYSTLMSVDHGHCWRTITCCITAPCAVKCKMENVKCKIAIANTLIDVAFFIVYSFLLKFQLENH